MSQSEVVGLKEDDAIARRPMSANTNKLDLNMAEDVTGELKAKHSQSLTFNVEISDKLVENTKVNVQEHTIFVDGTELSERREMEIILDQGQARGYGHIT